MSKNIKKDLATSLTTLVFLVVGITGTLMYFHLFNSKIRYLHEILGLTFIVAALFHVLFNWKSMKNYFSKKIFLVSFIIILGVSLSFIITASKNGSDPKMTVLKAFLGTPFNDAILILGQDMDNVKVKLKKVGITYNNEKTLRELAKKNKKSPFYIVRIITSEN